MITKICKECKLEKDNDIEFYKHPLGVMGTLPRCKECICKGRKTERELIMSRGSDKRRFNTDKRKIFVKERLKKYKVLYPEKVLAQRMIANYLKKFPNTKPTKCAVTGAEGVRLHLHHFDYTKPNEVIPCTPKIHTDFHRGIITEIKEEWIIRYPF